MSFEFGDVVLVRFPFTNQAAFKQRPAVVVSNCEYNDGRPDVVIMAITSQLRGNPTLGETRLVEWQAADLIKPSAVKPVFATLEKALVVRTLGKLHPTDAQAVRNAIAAVLG